MSNNQNDFEERLKRFRQARRDRANGTGQTGESQRPASSSTTSTTGDFETRLAGFRQRRAQGYIPSPSASVSHAAPLDLDHVSVKYPGTSLGVSDMDNIDTSKYVSKLAIDAARRMDPDELPGYIMSDPSYDYEKYTKIGAQAQNPSWEDISNTASINGWNPMRPAINNKVQFAFDAIDQGVLDGYSDSSENRNADVKKLVLPYRNMNDTQRALYNYYVGIAGQEGGDAYLESIQNDLNRKEAVQLLEDGGDSQVAHAATSLGSGLESGITGIKGAANMLTGNDTAMPYTPLQLANMANRNGMHGIEKVTNDLLYTVGNMAPSMLAGAIAGPGVGAAVLGGTSGGNAYDEALKAGYGARQAQDYGVLTGLSESLMQYALGGISKLGKYGSTKLIGETAAGRSVTQAIEKSLQKIVSNPVTMNALKKASGYAGSMVSEGTEEYLQEILAPVIRNITLDENNDFKPFSEDALYAGLLGALTAGALEVAPNVASDISSSLDAKRMGQKINESGNLGSFMDYANSADVNTTLYKMADYVAQKQQAGKSVSDFDAGALAYAAAIDANNKYVNAAMAAPNEQAANESTYEPDMIMYEIAPVAALPNEVSSQASYTPNVPTQSSVYEEKAIQPYADEYSGNGKQAMIDNYDGTVDPEVYSKGYHAYYGEGRYGMEYGQTNSLYGEMLPEQVRMAAYEAGVADRNIAMKSQAQLVNSSEPGGLMVASENATDAQKEFADLVGKKTGLKFEIVDSMPEAFGEYNKGTVKVALDSKNFAGTVSHELTHYIKDYAPQDYQAYQDIAVQAMMQAENVKYDELVETYLNRYRQNNDSFTRDDAVDEIVANATERFFSDEDYIEKIIKENKTLGQRILDFLNDLIDSIKRMVKSIFPESKESQALNENLEMAQQAQELWYTALDKAAEQAKGQVINGKTKYQLNEFGFEEYSAHEKQNMSNGKINFVNNVAEIESFVDYSLKSNEFKRLFFGKIGSELASKIQAATGINVEGYNVSLSSDNVRKIIKDHGSEETEIPRGQIPITKSILAQIPEIISSFDSISRSYDASDGRQSIIMSKDINGRKFVVEYVSGRRKTLDTQTMYASVQTNRNLVTAPDEQASAIRPKTFRDTVPTDNSISPNKGDIKSQLKEVDYLGDYWFEESSDPDMTGILQQEINLAKGSKIGNLEINRIANRLLKNYNSSYDKGTLTENLNKLFSYLESGESIDGAEVASAATSIAKSVLSQSLEADTTLSDTYKDLKDFLRTTKIQLSDQDKADLAQYGGYNTFRKNYFGKLRLGNDGISVDSLYQELIEQYPELFDSQITHPADQLVAIADVADSLKPVQINPYGASENEMAAIISYEIFDDYFSSVHSVELDAVKEQYKKKLSDIKNELRAKYDKRLAEVKKRKNQERTYERQYLRAEYEQNLAAEKRKQQELRQEKRDALYAQQVRYRERIQKSKNNQRERQAVKKYKNRIMKNVMDMKTWLLKPTETKHVPEELRKITADFLGSIDFSSNRLNKYGEPTRRTELWNKLKEEYKKISEGSQDWESGILMDTDPDFVPRLQEFIDNTSQVQRLEDMNSEQLKDLDLLVGILKHTIQDANKLISNARYKTISDISKSFASDNMLKKNKTEYVGIRGSIDKMFNMDMLDARSFFEELGPSAMTLYDELRAGLDKKIRNTQEAASFIQQLTQEVDIKEWTGRKAEVKEFNIGNRTVRMNPAQVMSLYLLNKREQARRHLYAGGFRVDSIVKNDKKNNMYEPVVLSKKGINQIISSLTPGQKAVADGIAKFFGTTISDWGNEVSLVLYGYKKFTESNYFPIISDSDVIPTSTVETGEQNPTLKNLGFTKNTSEKANNPLVIQDIFDVFTKHADQMASYNAFVIPLSDLQKFLNYKEKDGINVKRTLWKKMGEGGKKYILQLMQDINGLVKTDKTFGEKMISNMKGAAVGANLRVIVQQPTSWVRAMAEIDPKYLLKGLVMKGGKSDIMKEYAPIARWKDWGFFEMDTGRRMKDIFMGTEGVAKLKELAMSGAQWADNVTWERLWNAVEIETMDKQKTLVPGSKEFYEIVGKRFSEIIDKTQVVDSILHRTQIMRSKNTLSKMATSFMSESMKTYNMLRNAFVDVSRSGGSNESKAKAVKVSVVFMMNAVATAMAAALIDMLRDDDNDKSYGQKYKEALVENIIENVSPWNYIPYLKDIASLFSGYSVTRMDMSAIEDMKYSIKRWDNYISGESPYTIAFLVKDTVGNLSKVTGIPVKNLMRELDGFMNLFVNMLGNDGLRYVVDRSKLSIGSKKNLNFYAKKIVDALYNGNSALATRIYNDMVTAGYDNDTIDERRKNISLKKLKEDSLVADLFYAQQQADTEEIARLTKELESYGYSKTWIQSAVKSFGDVMYSSDELDSTYTYIDDKYFSEESGSYYTYDMLFIAIIEKGYKSEDFQEMMQDMKDNGKEEEEIMSAMKSRATKELMPDYVKARDNKDYDTWETLRKQLLNVYQSVEKLNDAEKAYRRKTEKEEK